MPFNGSGGTSQPASSIYPAVPSTLIESAKANISIADLYTMLGLCIVKDGQSTTTASIPFASGIQTDTVSEKTVDTGITLDGVLLKDGRIDTAQGADIVCAATINLETATGNVVDVTGSTGPVTAVTLSQGHWRLVRFTSTPTITHGASLVLPNAVDYTCAAGDYILFVGYASSVVRAYIMPASGNLPFVDTQPVVVGSVDKTKKVRFEVDGLTTATTRVVTVQDRDGTASFIDEFAYANLAGSSGRMPLPRMWISGLTYSNSVGDPTNDIDIAAGSARGSSDAHNLILAASLTKQLDAAWAVGTNAGGLDTGAIGNSDYYIWLIKRSDTGVVDALFSLSATAPTMPTNYDVKRLIGWFKRVGATIVAFHTYETAGGGLEQSWDVPTLDINLANTLTTTRRTDAVKVPLDFSTIANLNVVLTDASTSHQDWIYCPDQTDAAPSPTAAPLATQSAQVGTTAMNIKVRTSSTGTIAARSTLATVDLYAVATLGFTWARRN